MFDPAGGVCIAALTQVAGSYIVSTVAGGIIEGRADSLFCKLMGRTVDHFVKNMSLPANHDLMQGIISSNQKALAYTAETMSAQARDPRDRIVADKIIEITQKQMTFDAGYVSALKSLVAPLLAGDIEGDADARRAALIDHTTDALIKWLEAESGETLPPHFRAALTEAAPTGRAPWLAVFQLYLSEEIKVNPRFGQMFLAENISEIAGRTITLQSLAEDMRQGVRLIGNGLELVAADVRQVLVQQQEQGSQIDELLALARQGGIFQQAGAQGISEAAVRAIVEKLGGEGVSRNDLLGWLEAWIEAAKDAIDRISNEDDTFEAARAEAKRRFRAGQSAMASDPFMELLKREQAKASYRQITIIEEAIRFDMIVLNLTGIVAKMRLLATVSGFIDPIARAKFFVERARACKQQGNDLGDNLHLLVAIEAYRLGLEEMSRDHLPLFWADTQVNLASALYALGIRESGIARLEEAVAACRLALEEWTRERVPREWASTQMNLASALCALGKREGGTARLEEAVATYRLALEERTRERVPREWALTQMNLAGALIELGERESGIARIEEAVTGFRLALEEQSREREPLRWALTQMNLASALLRLGERERGTARLEEAVAVYRLALEELSREREPLYWATAHMNLANSLSALGEHESGSARLEEAVAAYRLALEEQTRERVPLDWALTQMNLAGALIELGERESGTARIEEAVAACRLALEELSREHVPLYWGLTQRSLASALFALGERESGTARLEEGLTACLRALEELPRERVPLYWASTQINLASGLLSLCKQIKDFSLIDNAETILSQARTVAIEGGDNRLFDDADELLNEAAKMRCDFS